MSKLLLLFIVILALSRVSSCSSENVEVPQNNPVSNIQNIKSISSDNGRIFVKEGGWEIPGLISWQKKESYSRKFETGDGKKLTITMTDFVPQADDTEEPFKSIGSDLGLIHINAIKEFSVGGHTFCYKIQGNRVGYGSLFPYAFYDEDGDGSFESLVLDEKDNMGINSFFSWPHIPKWIITLNDS